jgi:hypothetical protein
MNRGSIPGRGKRLFPPPEVSERIWGTPSPLPNGSRGKMGLGLKLATHHNRVSRLREVELNLCLPYIFLWRSQGQLYLIYIYIHIETQRERERERERCFM